MQLKNILLPSIALGATAALLVPVEQAGGFTTIGGNLNSGQRDFRVYNSFTDPAANNNQTPDPNFPGALGAVMSIWKGCVEWGTLHADGNGDPHQPGGLGSGNSNFECFFAGETNGVGSADANIHSTISSCSGGTLAFTESPISNGWRIRYCENWTWNDGPGTNISGIDLQGVACHEYGHALGLGHSQTNGATMFASISGTGVNQRSIASDDINGVQFIYGTVSGNKPHIDSVSISAGSVTINGSNFSSSGNEVWFTEANTSSGDSTPILKVTNVSSNGSQITVSIPANASPGHIAVKKSGTSLDVVSNPWPFDPSGQGGCDPQVSNFCSSTVNSSGMNAIMAYAGSTSVSTNDFTLLAFGCPPNQNGIFFYGDAQTNVPFGNGIRCVGAGFFGVFRLPVIQTDIFGDASYHLDFTQPPANGGPGWIIDGTQWYFQFWFRDPPAGGAGFNLSDGLDVTFCP